MRNIRVYCPPGEKPPIVGFLCSLERRFSEKIIGQIFRLADTPLPMMREPHVKHFVIEKYSRLFELREKNKILVRIIFTIEGEDIILLAPFIKKHPRDTMQALNASLKMLANARDDPAFTIKFENLKEELS